MLSPRGEQYARKLPDLVRESVGVCTSPYLRCRPWALCVLTLYP